MLIKRGCDKSSVVEGESEQGMEILDGESNSFGFFVVVMNVGFVYVGGCF